MKSLKVSALCISLLCSGVAFAKTIKAPSFSADVTNLFASCSIRRQSQENADTLTTVYKELKKAIKNGNVKKVESFTKSGYVLTQKAFDKLNTLANNHYDMAHVDVHCANGFSTLIKPFKKRTMKKRRKITSLLNKYYFIYVAQNEKPANTIQSA